MSGKQSPRTSSPNPDLLPEGARRMIPPVPGIPIRAALLLGFGLALGLWFFAGYRLTQQIMDLKSETTAIGAHRHQTDPDAADLAEENVAGGEAANLSR